MEQKNAELEAELREASRLNRQLTTKLLVNGVGDKDAVAHIAQADGEQGGFRSLRRIGVAEWLDAAVVKSYSD